MMFDRRALMQTALSGVAGLLAFPGDAFAQPQGAAFSHATVIERARAVAAQPFVPPRPVPKALRALDYDLYRQIRYRRESAIWGTSPTAFSIQFFAPGFLFESGVEISVVESGYARRVLVNRNSFETPSEEIGALLASVGQLAGFRLHYPINRPDYDDEFIVFQGASYFRAVSRGQAYGLSARGLALDVGEPGGEEFPVFREFWIERPHADAHAIVVHALLDSPSVAGAYRFAVYSGAPTAVDVDATLFPRVALEHVGLGALTSMFMHGPVDPPDRPDYRPAVHDSLGLAMHTGSGEYLWRPLNNPAALQISAFVDRNPRGFGLVQRARRFADFEDLEAAYERRPSAWVVPRGDWGEGHVQLVEIPSDSEINDNIVAYWRPAQPILADAPYRFSCRLTWPDHAPPRRGMGMARVARTGYGLSFIGALPQFAIDYAGGSMPDGVLTAEVSASAGQIAETVVQELPGGGGFRVFVTLDPGPAKNVELRVAPRIDGRPAGETWLYRWLGG